MNYILTHLIFRNALIVRFDLIILSSYDYFNSSKNGLNRLIFDLNELKSVYE